jgi:hypothetical protein
MLSIFLSCVRVNSYVIKECYYILVQIRLEYFIDQCLK